MDLQQEYSIRYEQDEYNDNLLVLLGTGFEYVIFLLVAIFTFLTLGYLLEVSTWPAFLFGNPNLAFVIRVGTIGVSQLAGKFAKNTWSDYYQEQRRVARLDRENKWNQIADNRG